MRFKTFLETMLTSPKMKGYGDEHIGTKQVNYSFIEDYPNGITRLQWMRTNAQSFGNKTVIIPLTHENINNNIHKINTIMFDEYDKERVMKIHNYIDKTKEKLWVMIEIIITEEGNRFINLSQPFDENELKEELNSRRQWFIQDKSKEENREFGLIDDDDVYHYQNHPNENKLNF